MSKLKVGITTRDEMSIWSNGLDQNIYFLYKMLEDMNYAPSLISESYGAKKLLDISVEQADIYSIKKFDIILEDSTHKFDDQINLCEIAYKYMNSGGILIIEDIFRNEDETRYLESLQSVKDYYSDMFFIETEHVLKYSPEWNNDKLMILIKK